jgi:hypothetical protein
VGSGDDDVPQWFPVHVAADLLTDEAIYAMLGLR